MDNRTFNPEIRLNRSEQAYLAAMYSLPGYKIMHRLFRSEVDRFVLNLINADSADEREVYARHTLAKAAAQFYQAVTNRVNEEVIQYQSAETPNEVLLDQTEGALDIGAVASTFDDMDEYNFLGEGNE